MGLGWYRSLPDGPSCVADIKRRIAPIIGHVSTEIPDFGLVTAVTAASRRMKNFVRRTLIDERGVLGFFDPSGVDPDVYACVDLTLLPQRFCHHCSISLR